MSKRILIIEDEAPLAEEWERGLTPEGYEIYTINHLSEIPHILSKLDDFDLVLLDVMLPSIDVSDVVDLESIGYGRSAGVWVAKSIKEKKPSLPIVVVTIVEDPGIIQNLRDAGVRRVLNKPFSNEELVAVVKLLLEPEL